MWKSRALVILLYVASTSSQDSFKLAGRTSAGKVG